MHFYRSIDVHSLIGNIGGYIGLCLGYNLLQVPALITTVLRILKDYFKSQKFFKSSNYISKSLGTNEDNLNGQDDKTKKMNNND